MSERWVQHPANWKGGIILSGDYIGQYNPLHDRAGKNGYVRQHLLIAEKALGRSLPKKAQVHHVNGIPSDNRPSNLVICENQAYHRLLHQRMRAYQACGNPEAVKCRYCGVWDVIGRNEMFMPKVASHSYHRQCSVNAARERRR